MSRDLRRSHRHCVPLAYAVLQDEWIDNFAALHATRSDEIQLSGAVLQVQTEFSDHESSAAIAPRIAVDFI